MCVPGLSLLQDSLVYDVYEKSVTFQFHIQSNYSAIWSYGEEIVKSGGN